MKLQKSSKKAPINVNLIGANKLFYAFDASLLSNFEKSTSSIDYSNYQVKNYIKGITPTPIPEECHSLQDLMIKYNGRLPLVANSIGSSIKDLRIKLGINDLPPYQCVLDKHQITEECLIVQKLLRLLKTIDGNETSNLLDIIQERRERCLLLLGGLGENGESFALNHLAEAPTMPGILGIVPISENVTSTPNTNYSQNKKKKKKKSSSLSSSLANNNHKEIHSSSDIDGHDNEEGDEEYSSASSRRNLKRRLQRKEKRDKRMSSEEDISTSASSSGSGTIKSRLPDSSSSNSQNVPRRKSTPKPEYIDTWARGQYFSMLKPNITKMVDRMLLERFSILPRPQIPTFRVCKEMETLRLLIVELITKQKGRSSLSEMKPLIKIDLSPIEEDDGYGDGENFEVKQKDQQQQQQQQQQNEEEEREEEREPQPKRRIGSRKR